jgi:hypothetical protein
MLNFLLFTSVLATRTERATSTPTLAPTITTRAASDQVDRQTDKRMNWYMDLDNGKKVLLGSNSSATMTVASVDELSLGSYSDPKEHSVSAKSIEIEHALKDRIVQIMEYPLSFVQESVDPAEIAKLSEHFSTTTYKAVQDCTRLSLETLKGRVAARSLATFLFIDKPLFEVSVEMTPKGAKMNPELGEIQTAINTVVKAVLSCSKQISLWENDDNYASGKKVFDVVSKDKDVVRVVLLLTGSLEGVKRQVYEYMHTMTKYDYLWKENKKAAYNAFMSKDPSLEDFEAELKKYDLVEQEIMRIPQKHNIGAIALETLALKTALSTEAKAWKKQYAQNLHGQARTELATITEWIEKHTRYLKRELNDLDDVRLAVGYLAAIREKETMLDWEFGPILEKYSLLTKYNVDIPKEETDQVDDLEYAWRRLKTVANGVNEHLGAHQMQYKKTLVRKVRMFVIDVAQFRSDFEANGPGVPGLPPLEASYPWVSWGALIPGWSFTAQPDQLGKQFASLLIPTIDSVRCEYSMGLSISQNRAVILVGGPGTAKTSIILSVLHAVDPIKVTFKKMSFSQATTPSIFQRQIEASVEKRQGKTFGPPNNKRMLCFIDDISMPLVNEWGDQITLEIVRMQIENRGFYSLDKPGEFTGIVDVLILGAMLHPGAGKNDIPNRAKRHFHVMNVTLPSNASINQIFGAMSSSFFGWSKDDAIKEMATNLVSMTISIWDRIKTKMLPTPAKFHYLFNLRDLSRVFQGIFNINVLETLTDSFMLLALWKHECMRVFSDKLIDKKDKAWFAKEIFVVLEPFASKFGPDIEKLQSQKDIYFVDFLRDADEDPETGELLPAPKVYEALPYEQLNDARKKAIENMKRFNETFKLLKMDLVFFHDALEHLCRIITTRLFALSRGCALLVGVGGSGKQSLTRLSSFICNATCFQITLTKTYNGNNLLEDFKPHFKAGVTAKPTIFMLTDKEIKDEGFLEYFNIFLSTGELPSLFPRDEYDAIIGELSEKYQAMYKGSEPTVDQLWVWFIERVRSNLHLSLCFSPVGVKFSQRAQKFPGLINGTTIDWFLMWAEEALTDVATAFIGSFDALQGDAAVRGKLIKHVVAVQVGMNDACEQLFKRYRRKTYVTPKSYLGFIEEYKGVYVRKLEGVKVLANSINTGLDKLRDAAADVEKIKIEVREKEKTLIVAQEKGAIMLQEITASTAKAEKEKAEVQVDKDTLGSEAAVIGQQKDDVEKDLLAAKPALDDAENALKAITAKDIGLLKQLKMPPDLVKRTFDVVLILFQREISAVAAETVETKRGQVLQLVGSWPYALTMMADIGFLGNLDQFNKNPPDFTPDDARKVASALAGLCTWTRAMALYVAKVVKPKMESLAQAESKLKNANAKLAKAQGELDQVARELDEMTLQFNQALATKQALQDDADACNKKMEVANRLIAGEPSRWKESSAGFADEIACGRAQASSRTSGAESASTCRRSSLRPIASPRACRDEIRAGLRATWRRRAPSSRTSARTTPSSASTCRRSSLRPIASPRACRAPMTSASRSSSSTRALSVTGTSRACFRTISPSRTASW